MRRVFVVCVDDLSAVPLDAILE